MEVIKGEFKQPQEDLQGLLEDLTLMIELALPTTNVISVIGVLEILKMNLLMDGLADEDDC